jgi:putative addiction module CopG family antidote
MATKSYNVSVTEAQGWFVEQQVRLGRYNNISEVMRDGLRRLETEAAQRDIDEFNRLFTGAHNRPETEAEIQRINRALKKARAK